MKLFITILIVLALTMVNGWSNDLFPEKTAEKYARISLKDKAIFLKNKVDAKEMLDKKEPFSLYLFGKENAPDFYVVITQAKGRYDMFDYLVAINSKLEVETVRILKYRSEHGGEIGSKKWLKQFIGNTGNELKYKKDISAISGATLSARSITADVPRVMNIVRANLE